MQSVVSVSGIAISFAFLALVIVSAKLWQVLGERRRAETQATECGSRFQATFEQAAVGIAHVSVDGNWLRVNDKICQIVGYSRDELMRKTFQDITHADDLDTDLAYVKQMLMGKINRYAMEKRYVHKRGVIVWVRLTVSLTRKAGGEPDYFISVIEDITQTKQADAELIKLHVQADALMEQQVIAQTIFALAHELNQPLNAAGSYSEAALRLAKAENLNRDKLLQVIQLSVVEIQRAGNVMRNLMQNVQHSGQVTESFELVFALHEAIKMFQKELYEKHAVVVLACEDKEIWVSATRLGLEKVLMNLLWNAHQAVVSGNNKSVSPKIIIRVTQRQDAVLITVIDNGPPVIKQVADKLFEPFFTTKSKGVGMGLAISRTLVESCNGKLWYDPVDGQTAFHFSIKLSPGKFSPGHAVLLPVVK